jgi:hypothetical protein
VALGTPRATSPIRRPTDLPIATTVENGSADVDLGATLISAGAEGRTRQGHLYSGVLANGKVPLPSLSRHRACPA